MQKFMTVLRREYLSRVRTKGFILGTFLIPLFMVGVSILPALLVRMKSEDQRQIVVIDVTGQMFDDLQAALDETTETGARKYNLMPWQASAGDLENAKKMLAEEIDQKRLDSYIFIPADILESSDAELYGRTVSNFQENERIEDAFSRIVTEARIKRSGLDPTQVRWLTRGAHLRTYKIAPGGKEEEDRGYSFAMSYILVMFLYMTMVIYGAMVLRSVQEEKTSRVIEAVISSIKPFHLMAGKIFGVGAVGLTQFLIWAVVLGAVSLYGSQLIGVIAPGAKGASIPTVPIVVLVYFVVFFVLGYFLYSTLYAAVGAIVNSEQEAQQLQFPIIMLLIVPIMLIMYIIQNPGAQASVILSLIPFFAPMIMFARIVVQMPPLWEILASLSLMVATILGLVWAVGRIYRVGVLMYGKRPTLPELIKWIRYA